MSLHKNVMYIRVTRNWNENPETEIATKQAQCYCVTSMQQFRVSRVLIYYLFSCTPVLIWFPAHPPQFQATSVSNVQLGRSLTRKTGHCTTCHFEVWWENLAGPNKVVVYLIRTSMWDNDASSRPDHCSILQTLQKWRAQKIRH